MTTIAASIDPTAQERLHQLKFSPAAAMARVARAPRRSLQPKPIAAQTPRCMPPTTAAAAMAFIATSTPRLAAPPAKPQHPSTSGIRPAQRAEPRVHGPEAGTPEWDELLERLVLACFGDMPAASAPWWLRYGKCGEDDDDMNLDDWLPDGMQCGFGFLMGRGRRTPAPNEMMDHDELLAFESDLGFEGAGFHCV